jgi:cytochrome c oxidase subunit 1
VFLAGFASIFTGINFLVTIHKMRAPGMTWFRLPLFVWAMYATSLIQVLGTPVVAITLLLVAVERTFRIGIFDPNSGRRPDSVSAPVLVLLAPSGLHHDSARDGRD